MNQKSQDQTTSPKSKFSGDILKLVSGTVLAQGLSVLAAPILARLYAPSAFGILALFMSISGIIAVVVSLRYELTIMLPARDEDAANLLAGSMGISIIVSLITIPIVLLGGKVIGIWLNSPELVPFLWLLPIVIFFGGIGAGHPALNAWASRKRNFHQVSATRVIGSVTTLSSKLISGLTGFNTAGGLIQGSVAGSILSPLLLGWQIWREDRHLFLANIRWSRIWAGLKRYRKFPFYNTLSGLLNTISWQVPSFMLSAFFSTTVVGYYAMGNQLLRIPMDLIGASIGQAFYAHAATAYQDGTLATLVENTFRRLVEFSFFPILMLTVIGKEIFTIVFGAQWAEAGVYTQILSLWMIFWFISSPMSGLYNVLEKNESLLGLNVVILITRILSIWLGGAQNSPRLALLFFSLSGMFIYGYLSISIIIFAGVPWRNIFQILFKNVGIFLPVGGFILLLKLVNVSVWIQLGIVVLSVGIYFVYRFQGNIYYKRFVDNLLGSSIKK